MKRIFAAWAAAMLLLTLTACKKPAKYVPSEEVEVALAFVEEEAVVVTRRLVAQELQSVELACNYYTAEGEKIGTYQRIECDFSTQDTLSIWNFEVPENCRYMEAVVASVTYPDGTKKDCEGVTQWGEKQGKFDLQAYQKNIEKMKENQGAAAENCPAVAVQPGALKDGKQKLELTAGKTAVKDLTLYVLWYDETGAPVDCGGLFVKNAESISSGGLQAQQTAYYSIEAPVDAASAKIIIRKVNFENETPWENTYFYEWAFVNNTME